VPVKLLIGQNVKVLVMADGSQVDLAKLKMSMNFDQAGERLR
jgi:hypothetical protein